jgi:flagellar basal body-associated protein FliL
MKITFDGFCRFWFLLAVAGLISMLPFSKYVISMSQMVMATAWAVQRFDWRMFVSRLKGRPFASVLLISPPLAIAILLKGIAGGFRDLVRNKPVMAFLSIFLLHVAGLVFTTDFDYAFKDLRTKLPLLLLPLFLGTSKPIGKKMFNAYLMLFLLALLVGTLIYGWRISQLEFRDIRDVSKNVSHIILGLELALGIFISGRFIFGNRIHWALRGLLFVLSSWFLVYILYSRSFTGLAVFAITLMIILPVLVFRQKRPGLKILLSVVLVLFTAGIAIYSYWSVKQFYTVNSVDKTRLDSLTLLGNPYTHNTASNLTENGNYLYLYCQFDEMREAWNRRSSIPYDSTGVRGEKIEHTLVRYLSSRNLRKDAGGVNALSDREILAVERGIPNYLFLDRISMKSRIFELLRDYEAYRETGDPTGATLMQRLEFWKASAGIIKETCLTGVGTGDMNEAFRDEYIRMNTKLPPDQRWRSHNQYLSVLVGFGILGLALFLFALIYPAVELKAFKDYYFLAFFIIAALSMLTEDTIESQMGVTFVTFFYCFFLFARREYDPV